MQQIVQVFLAIIQHTKFDDVILQKRYSILLKITKIVSLTLIQILISPIELI